MLTTLPITGANGSGNSNLYKALGQTVIVGQGILDQPAWRDCTCREIVGATAQPFRDTRPLPQDCVQPDFFDQNAKNYCKAPSK